MPSRKKLELTLTVRWVVSTKVGVPTLTPSKKTRVLALKFRPKMFTVDVGAPTFTAPGVTELNAASGGTLTSVSWRFHMLRPCVAARKIRELRRMASPRTGEFGNPSPSTVQFWQGVAASGSGQEKTPTSVAIYNASKVFGLPW